LPQVRRHALLSSFWRLTRSGKRLFVLAVAAACLVAPATARANGDPASDYLLTQDLFLPFTTKIDRGEVTRLGGLLKNAKQQKYPIRVALILSPSDLGTAFSLFRKPQRYSEFLGLELSFVYRGRLLVVMPNGYGYAVNGVPDAKTSAVLAKLPPPGADATKEAKAAIVAVPALASASGIHLTVPKGGGTTARDRVTIAAIATAGVALIAAFVLYRRQRRTLPE
jgi:hypothetical protein